MELNAVFEQIRTNLQARGYGIQENISFGDFSFQMVGHLALFEVGRFGISDYFFTVGHLTDPTLVNIRAFSSQSYGYAGKHRSNSLPPGLFGGYWVFPIVVVNQLSDGVKEAVEIDCPPKHWSSIELPIVVDASTGKTAFFQGTPTWGMAYYAGFRALVSQMASVR